ncbi:MAG: M20/M25/M40 family metallo-hydrolase [Kangiellaceae bacterium]|nr:M20/M25/M40 family metallo-hydrolase [Kangiellaceae bacterium]
MSLFNKKRSKLVLIITTSIISGSVFSEPPKLLTDKELNQVVQVREVALKSNLGFQILESLTTEVGPRMAGTPQDTLAVKWAENKFKQLGFDKVWKEPVTYDTWVRGIETAEIVSPYPQNLHITALGGTVGTPEGGVKAQVVHFENLQELIKSKADTVKGKIVFISNRMERTKNGAGYGKAVSARGKGAVEGAKKGAVAVIIRSIGTDTHRVPHTGLMRYEEGTGKIPAAALSNPDADQLMRILKRGQEVTISLKLGAHTGPVFTSYNVIGEMKGTSAADELVVLGGHLDSWDLGTGAVDDGAGVALTMAAASLIKAQGIKHKRSIRVILWANEEQGLVGAKAYAKEHAKDIKQHTIGSESDFGAGRIYSFSSLVTAKDMPFIAQMETLFAPLGITRGDNKAGPGPDLIPLYAKGMSVFRLAQDGTDYFDLHHTADDTLDKVDPAALAQNVSAYTVYALMTAQYEGDLVRPKKDKK